MFALNTASSAIVAAWNRPVNPARFAVIADPMHELKPSDLQPVPEDATFNDLIAGRGSAWMCQVVGQGCEAGTYLLPEWWNTSPRPGDVIVFHRRALGGRGDRRTLLTLAVLVVSIWAPGAAGLTGWQGAALSAGINVAGGLAINALVPLDAGNNVTQQQQSPTYSTSVQGNQARLGQPIPVLYGHNLTYPDFACKAYQTFEDNDQYYHAVLCIGMGQYDVLKIDVDDTPLDLLDDVEYVIVGPGQADGATLADQTLVKTNVWTNAEAANQDMDSLKVIRFTVVPRDRQATALGVDVALPRGLDAARSITWKVQARTINEFEQPTGEWITLADETYSTASPVPVRLSYRYTVTAGRYQLRTYRTDIRETAASAAHDLALIGLTCEFDEAGVDTTIPATYLCLKMRGSQQLNGISQSRMRVLSNRMLPTWNGTAWSDPVVTRSVAWAAADVLRNADYGRGLADDQIDLAGLLALDTLWASRFDKYDGVFDTASDTWGAMSQVLRVGRAVPLIRGSRYTFVRDGEDLEPVALYGMNNIRKGTFSLNLGVPERDQITALDIEYWDQTRWDWVTLTVQHEAAEDPPFIAYVDTPPGAYTVAENRARIKLPGVIGRNHAAREGAYRLADMLFRRSTATYRTHLDGLLPAYCAPVLIAHDIPQWGQSGQIVDYDSGTGVITTTEPLDWSAGGTHYMALQNSTGGIVEWTVTEGTEDNEAIVADDLGFTPLFESSNNDRTRYSFGPAANMGALCRVRAIVPRGERDIEHQVVLEDSRVHDADTEWRVDDPAISDGTTGPAEDSSILVVRVLDRTLGNAFADASPPATDIVSSISFNDNGTITATDSLGTRVLPNEWLQGGAVPSATAALYELRATTIVGALDTGTIGSWLQLDTTRVFEQRIPAGSGDAARTWTALFEIRDVATDSVQDVATIALNASVLITGGA